MTFACYIWNFKRRKSLKIPDHFKLFDFLTVDSNSSLGGGILVAAKYYFNRICVYILFQYNSMYCTHGNNDLLTIPV